MRYQLTELLREPSQFLFFTGKGGVGKTSLACASAVALADAGKPVLLVSTDPASNLDEVLGQKLTNAPTAIPGVPRLFALNIDPEQSHVLVPLMHCKLFVKKRRKQSPRRNSVASGLQIHGPLREQSEVHQKLYLFGMSFPADCFFLHRLYSPQRFWEGREAVSDERFKFLFGKLVESQFLHL